MINAGIFYVISILLLGLSDFSEKLKKYRYIFFFLILLVIWGGNRFNGADWINYINVYRGFNDENSILNVIYLGRFEWLFSIWMWIFSRAGIPYEGFVASIALVNILCLLWVIKKVRIESIGLCLITLFLIEGWTLYHEQLRQAIALSICLVAAVHFLNNRKRLAYFLIVFSTGFHSSAFFSLLFFYVINRVLRRKNAPLSLHEIILTSLAIVSSVGIVVVAMKLGVLNLIGLSRLQEKFEYYETDQLSGSSLINVGMIAYLLGFCILLWYRKTVLRQRVAWLSFAWSMAILWCFLGPWLRIFAIFTRFEHYLIIFIPFAVCVYSSSADQNVKQIAQRTLITILFSATFFIRIALNPEHQIWVLNYQNVFVSLIFDMHLDNVDVRKDVICENFSQYDNNFCGEFSSK
ncbi:MAG: EpsG family protein [Collimonas sp.]|uniref:EpsG family protein n=1 Tax=Collimonas sp. TaxID=1963772 RepID=UPI003263EB52